MCTKLETNFTSFRGGGGGKVIQKLVGIRDLKHSPHYDIKLYYKLLTIMKRPIFQCIKENKQTHKQTSRPSLQAWK